MAPKTISKRRRQSYHIQGGRLSPVCMKKVVNRLRRGRADAGNFLQIRDARAFHRCERPKMPQQRALSRRAHARNLLQAERSDVFFAAAAMRSDREAMRFV